MPVIITGANFFGVPTATLGANIPIAISAATTDTLTGTVPAGLVPGVYALRVTNPDGQSAILSPAYVVLDPSTVVGTGPLSIFGPAAPRSEGDDDHVQIIFFEVPDGTPGDVYVRVFDADTGGALDAPADTPVNWDTTITYTLRGSANAYTLPDARAHRPGPAGINSGTWLTQTVIGQDTAIPPIFDNQWGLVFGPYAASNGELVGSRRVFKLVIEGGSGNDGNYYQVALSTVADDNTPPTGSRIFAYSWTFPLTSGSVRRLYPYVPSGTQFFEQHNWDLDSPAGAMRLQTPIRTFDVTGGDLSGDGAEAWSRYRVDASEDEATWTMTMDFTFSGTRNDVTFWAVGDGIDLPIFTRPTMVSPP